MTRGQLEGEEIADGRRDLDGVGLQCEVSGLEESDRRAGDIALERLGPGGQEERIVLAPYRQEGRLVVPEILLEGRVERDVLL
jgi:hypothetical protein